MDKTKTFQNIQIKTEFWDLHLILEMYQICISITDLIYSKVIPVNAGLCSYAKNTEMVYKKQRELHFLWSLRHLV